MTFSVIWDTWSSTGRLLTQQIEPTEKTAPPRKGFRKKPVRED